MNKSFRLARMPRTTSEAMDARCTSDRSFSGPLLIDQLASLLRHLTEGKLKNFSVSTPVILLL